MPAQTQVQSEEIVAQGAWLELSLDDGVTYNHIPGVVSVPRIGVEGAFVEITSIGDLTKRFGSGIKTPPPWELAFNRIGDNAVQDSLIAAAEAGDTVKIRCTYQTGDIAVIDVVLNGVYSEEASQGDAVQMFAVSGQQSGDPVRSKVA